MWIRSRGDNAIIVCRVFPNAPLDSIEGIKNDQLAVRLSSTPVEGKANKALIRFMAKQLRIAQSKISIIQGEKARTKVLCLDGVTPENVVQILKLNQ